MFTLLQTCIYVYIVIILIEIDDVEIILLKKMFDASKNVIFFFLSLFYSLLLFDAQYLSLSIFFVFFFDFGKSEPKCYYKLDSYRKRLLKRDSGKSVFLWVLRNL